MVAKRKVAIQRQHAEQTEGEHTSISPSSLRLVQPYTPSKGRPEQDLHRANSHCIVVLLLALWLEMRLLVQHVKMRRGPKKTNLS